MTQSASREGGSQRPREVVVETLWGLLRKVLRVVAGTGGCDFVRCGCGAGDDSYTSGATSILSADRENDSLRAGEGIGLRNVLFGIIDEYP
jgi:hypothetical protein